MEFQENKNNYYTKELNDVDRYLLRIIKKYFDLENINSAASINAIIAEAMSRYKLSISYKSKGVNSLNNKTGIINVNISDFNGERKFEKNTAFNKSFGTEENTICEGNDERLYDKRKPKYHHHKISSVLSLKNTLDNFKKEIGKYGYHLHYNSAILNKIKYTGTKNEIDLAELENISYVTDTLLSILDTKTKILLDSFESNQALVNDLISQIYLFMEKLYLYIESENEKINNILINYVSEKLLELDSIKEEIEKVYVSRINLTNILEILNKSLMPVSIQDINLTEALEVLSTGETMKEIYDNSSLISVVRDGDFNHIKTTYTEADKTDRWKYNETLNTFECKVNESEYSMLLSDSKYRHYNHEVTLTSGSTDDDTIIVVLAVFEIDEAIYTLSLNVSSDVSGFVGMKKPNKFCVMLGYQTELEQEICYDKSFDLRGDWKNQSVRVRIERRNNDFRIYRSEIDSDIVSDIPCLEFNLDDVGDGHLFEEASRYGYGCFSQEDSKFLNVDFMGYQEVTLTQDKPLEQEIDFTLFPPNYDTDDIEIEAELVYNNTRVKLPYITEEFVISAGLMNNKLYSKFQLLKPEVTLPLDISIGKIRYNIYSKRLTN